MKENDYTDNKLQQLTEAYSWNETIIFLNARVRELKVDNGKLAAFITELEDKLKVQDKQLVAYRTEIAEIKNGKGLDLVRKVRQQALLDERVDQLQRQLESEKKTTKSLREDNWKLIANQNK